MRIVITGGAGSVGKMLVKALMAKFSEPQILILDNLSAGNTELDLLNQVQFNCIDIANREKLAPVIHSFNPNYVFHLAAHFANQNSVDFPFSDLDTNMVGTLNLLESCRDLKELRKIVYASSSCVYGASSEVMRESDQIFPFETPYAIHKYAGEMYMKFYNAHYGIPTCTVRLFNTYGPGENAGKYRNVIPNFIATALRNEDLVITGDGTEKRDFTYITDTCNLILKAALNESGGYQTFNGGTGKGVTINDLANTILKATNSKAKITYQPRRGWDHVHTRISDISKAKLELGYSPKVEFKEGIRETVEWFKSI